MVIVYFLASMITGQDNTACSKCAARLLTRTRLKHHVDVTPILRELLGLAVELRNEIKCYASLSE